jgi:hypothetical protein
MKTVNSLVIGLCLSILFSSPLLANEMQAKQPTVEMKVLDLLIVRPLSIAVSTVSTACYIVTTPITYPSGLSVPAARILVEAPWRFTGMRYLGDFKHYKDGHPVTVISEE